MFFSFLVFSFIAYGDTVPSNIAGSKNSILAVSRGAYNTDKPFISTIFLYVNGMRNMSIDVMNMMSVW